MQFFLLSVSSCKQSNKYYQGGNVKKITKLPNHRAVRNNRIAQQYVYHTHSNVENYKQLVLIAKNAN